MKCVGCGTDMELTTGDIKLQWSRERLKVMNIELHVCSNCGFYEIDPDDQQLIHQVGEKLSAYIDKIDLSALRRFQTIPSHFEGLMLCKKRRIVLLKV